jgi:hypothetical protein
LTDGKTVVLVHVERVGYIQAESNTNYRRQTYFIALRTLDFKSDASAPMDSAEWSQSTVVELTGFGKPQNDIGSGRVHTNVWEHLYIPPVPKLPPQASLHELKRPQKKTTAWGTFMGNAVPRALAYSKEPGDKHTHTHTHAHTNIHTHIHSHTCTQEEPQLVDFKARQKGKGKKVLHTHTHTHIHTHTHTCTTLIRIRKMMRWKL